MGTIKAIEKMEPNNKWTTKDYNHGTRNGKHFNISPGANIGNM